MENSIFKDWNIIKWIWNACILIITIYILGRLINITFAIGYIIMLFVHELGHMMAALGFDVHVRFGGFTPFGAYIQILDQTTLKENAIIAISGPLCGLATAVLYFFLFFLMKEPTFLWLSFFTGIVSLMNLLPLDPFDGGKVVQGACWYFPLFFLPLLGYGIYNSYRTAPLVASFLAFVIVYAISDVAQMKKRNRIDTLMSLEKPKRMGVFLSYLLVIVILTALLIALYLDYGSALFPKIQPITIPPFLQEYLS